MVARRDVNPESSKEKEQEDVEIEEVLLTDDQTKRIAKNLPEDTKKQFNNLLQMNADLFTYSTIDMLRVDLKIAQHRLNIDPNAKHVKQKKMK